MNKDLLNEQLDQALEAYENNLKKENKRLNEQNNKLNEKIKELWEKIIDQKIYNLIIKAKIDYIETEDLYIVVNEIEKGINLRTLIRQKNNNVCQNHYNIINYYVEDNKIKILNKNSLYLEDEIQFNKHHIELKKEIIKDKKDFVNILEKSKDEIYKEIETKVKAKISELELEF